MKIKQSYQQVLAPTGDMLQQLQVELAKLAHIKVDELKSLLSAKLMNAERRHIKVVLDIPQHVTNLPLPLATYLRIVSIFIDNAIESSSEIKSEARIQLAIFETERMHYIIVKKKLEENSIDIEKLYTKHYSSKGEQRGIGLFSVQRRMVIS